MAVLAVAYVAVPASHLADDAWDYDEGPQLQAAALASNGHTLYAEVALNKPPILTWVVEGAMAFAPARPHARASLGAARLALLVMTALGFLAMGAVAELGFGQWAGPATLAVLLCVRELPVRAIVVMNDVPALGAAAAALAAAMRARRSRGRARVAWAFASGASYAGVLGLHPLLFFVAVPIGIALLARRRGRVVVALAFAAGAAIVTTATLAFVDLRAMTRWIVEYNVSRGVHASVLAESAAARAFRYLDENAPVVAATLVGAAALVFVRQRAHRVALVAITTWIAGAVFVLALWRPLWDHYRVFALWPATLLAGGGLAVALRSRRRGCVVRGVAALAVAAMVALVVARVATPLRWATWTSDRLAAREYVAQSPRGYVVSDDPFLAFAAGRLCPAPLADTSYKSIATGFLDARALIEGVRAWHVRTVIVASGRFARLPDFITWLEAHGDARTFGAIRVYDVRE